MRLRRAGKSGGHQPDDCSIAKPSMRVVACSYQNVSECFSENWQARRAGKKNPRRSGDSLGLRRTSFVRCLVDEDAHVVDDAVGRNTALAVVERVDRGNKPRVDRTEELEQYAFHHVGNRDADIV